MCASICMHVSKGFGVIKIMILVVIYDELVIKYVSCIALDFKTTCRVHSHPEMFLAVVLL